MGKRNTISFISESDAWTDLPQSEHAWLGNQSHGWLTGISSKRQRLHQTEANCCSVNNGANCQVRRVITEVKHLRSDLAGSHFSVISSDLTLLPIHFEWIYCHRPIYGAWIEPDHADGNSTVGVLFIRIIPFDHIRRNMTKTTLKVNVKPSTDNEQSNRCTYVGALVEQAVENLCCTAFGTIWGELFLE